MPFGQLSDGKHADADGLRMEEFDATCSTRPPSSTPGKSFSSPNRSDRPFHPAQSTEDEWGLEEQLGSLIGRRWVNELNSPLAPDSRFASPFATSGLRLVQCYFRIAPRMLRKQKDLII